MSSIVRNDSGTVRTLTRPGLAPEDALGRRTRQLEALIRAGQELNRILEIPVVLRTVVGCGMELVEGAGGFAGLLRDGKLAVAEHFRDGGWHVSPHVFAPGADAVGRLIDHKLSFLCNDPASDPSVNQELRARWGIDRFVVVPIMDRKGGLLGCFAIFNKKTQDGFNKDDVSLLQALAASAAVAMENAMALAESQRTEQALKDSENLYRLLAENANDLIYLLDPYARIVFASPSVGRLGGHEATRFVGTSAFASLHPDDLSNMRKAWQWILAGEKAVLTFRLQHADGTWHWMEAWATLMQYQDKPHVMAVCRDVSERKLAEEALRAKDEELRNRLLQSQKMEAFGQLAGGVAHDFNNLLTVINGYSQIVFSRLNGDDPNRTMLVQISQAGERAADLTRQLLAFSRKQVLDPRVVNLNNLIEELTKMLRRMIGADISLEFAPDPELGPVKIDPGQFEQVLMNLAVNARDAMPTGGRIRIKTIDAILDVPNVRPGRCAVMEVSDTGHGMDEAAIARAFEPFFATQEVGRRTGLGLAAVYGIVQQSGGRIDVASEVGSGTTFRVCLPCIDDVEAATRPPSHFQIPRGTETVLVVEDEHDVRVLASMVLRSCGYTVLEARDGRDGGDIARHHAGPIDLLLTDVVMPRLSGPLLAEQLTTARPAIRTLFMSGYADDAIMQHGVLELGKSFLHKPFTPGNLAAKVREILDAERKGS